MTCPSQHLKWLEWNILQEKQWMEQLQEWSKLQRILLWRLLKSHHHIRCKRKEGLDLELLLWERSGNIKSVQTYWSEGSIPKSHIWDHVRYQEWPKNPGSSNKRFAGSSRGLFGRLVWRLQPVCYPCKMSYHHAKRCAACKKNMQREDLETSWPATQTWSFSGPPTYFKSRYILEKLPQCFQH